MNSFFKLVAHGVQVHTAVKQSVMEGLLMAEEPVKALVTDTVDGLKLVKKAAKADDRMVEAYDEPGSAFAKRLETVLNNAKKELNAEE